MDFNILSTKQGHLKVDFENATKQYASQNTTK